MSKRKTDAEFKHEVFDIVGNEYTFLESYQGATIKIKAKHNKCGNIYEVLPSNFLSGSRCPYCAGNHKKTNEDFKQKVYDLVGDEYTFLGSYVNADTKIRVKHNKCGNAYEVTPTHFLNGSRCPYCSSNNNKTDTQFRQDVYNLVGDEYTFLELYVNNYTKLKVKHNKCGKIYMVKPSHFLSGHRCPYCNGNINTKKTDADFKHEVFDIVGNEYTFLDAYVNANTKIKVRHNKCGHIYEVTPHHFLRGVRCPKCYGTPKKTNSRFKKEVYNLIGDEYVFLDTYVNNKTKLRVKHNKCGNVYEVRPTDFFSHNARCPYCSSSKGEDLINKILKSLNIEYEYQKTFEDLKDTQLLSYDFYIPSQNILIEYQGIQHYHSISYFGGGGQLKLQQKHDQMKLEYAKAHHYNLIAVPYTEDTFSKIKKYLIKHGLSRR